MKGVIERLNKKLTVPLAYKLRDKREITPNRITLLGFIFSGILAPLLILNGLLVFAGVFVYLGALLDSLDGDLARARGESSKEGAILDAVLDRYSDLLILFALILYDKDCLEWGLLAVLGSSLVPYVRAKTEAVGKSSISTLGSRDTRNLILLVGLLFSAPCFTLITIALVSNFSALHRLFYALRKEV